MRSLHESSKENKKKKKIKSAYSVLIKDVSKEAPDEEFKELWKLKVPSKVAVFAWRLLKDRLPTRDNLRRKQIELQDYLCPFCRIMEESASHLFFHCSKILPLWWESLSWVNLVGVFPHIFVFNFERVDILLDSVGHSS